MNNEHASADLCKGNIEIRRDSDNTYVVTETSEEKDARTLKAVHDAKHDHPAPRCPWCDEQGWQD